MNKVHHQAMKLIRLAGIALLLAGCAGLMLTPEQKQAALEAQRFADQIAEAYKVPKVRVVVGGQPAGLGGQMREDGVLLVQREAATSAWLRRITVAHEMAHWINRDADWAVLKRLWNESGGNPNALLEYSRTHIEPEADVKAVEILQRVEGLSEREAFTLVYTGLREGQRLIETRQTTLPRGHPPVCTTIAILLARYPAQAGWAKPCD